MTKEKRFIKVMKFGGGCLRTPWSFRRVADIISASSSGRVVVVSALFGITDVLTTAVQDALDTEHGIRDTIRIVSRIHLHIIEHGISDGALRAAAKKELADLLKKLKRLLTGLSFTGEITPSLRAHVLSFGERLSARLMAAALRERGLNALPLDSEYVGMFTNDGGANATAILTKVAQSFSRRILPLVDNGTVPVITGFYGCTPDFKLTLFGRNGTDYSAAVIAHAGRARILEIWKDVSGFMSADPKIVDSPHRIGILSYREAAELASFGARILHPRTVEPALLGGIPIDIKDIHQPEHPGTRITARDSRTNDGPKSITHSRDAAILKIGIPAGVRRRRECAADIQKILRRRGVHIYSVITTPTGILFLISERDAIPGYRAVRRSGRNLGRNAELEKDIALIGVVGHGMHMASNVSARIFSTLRRENIDLEMFVSGASPNTAYFAVRETAGNQAVAALHREFFPNNDARDTFGVPAAE